MKRIFLLVVFCFTSILNVVYSQQPTESKKTKVEQLTYDDFIKYIWDFEKNPSTFVFKGDLPTIVDFYADWCGPCRRVAPIMEKLAQEYDGKIIVYKVNTDQQRKLAATFQIRSIPTVLFFPQEGKPHSLAGALTEAQYKEKIEQILLSE